MTLVVPFDGSDLAGAALGRAAEFATVFDEDILAVTVIPDENADYARDRGWIGPGEAFDLEMVVSALDEQVTALCPGADFRHETVGKYAPPGTISKRLRRVAKEVDATGAPRRSANSTNPLPIPRTSPISTRPSDVGVETTLGGR